MKGDHIKFCSGFKYQLEEDYEIVTPFSGYSVEAEYITLSPTGLLTVKDGYAWDGPSGPTIDTPSSMRASLVHDALYQLIREGFLPEEAREEADNMLYRLCLEDGMWQWRARLWYRGVRDFAGSAAAWKNERKVITAP